ncbi:hypothetical protein EYF80_021768 [Liparis tanakae]|uniref:Uncharacterized protein n=1 Tax=Liparis tanakae TaxID=230148 RepID=A0A4Z2HQ65_9TELE|nr:hypothetical protein EYF80_021768 [Liparis tanakae]
MQLSGKFPLSAPIRYRRCPQEEEGQARLPPSSSSGSFQKHLVVYMQHTPPARRLAGSGTSSPPRDDAKTQKSLGILMACLVANLRTQSWQRNTPPLLLQSSCDCGDRKDSRGTSFSERVWESLAVCFGDSLARSLILNPRWASRWHTYAAGVRI